jgi:hypothetical protein
MSTFLHWMLNGMRNGPFRLIGIIFATLSSTALAFSMMPVQEAAIEQRILTAVRLSETESIDLDGELAESVWERAIPATGFIQLDPLNGEPATEETEVRVVYDDGRIFISVICYDSDPGALRGNQMLRDAAFSGDDRFMFVIDPFLDERNGYFFEINPSGAMGDGLVNAATGSTNISVNKSWDGIWNARVAQSPIGWTIEIEIPFRTLNFDPNASAWGINFQRTVRRKNEESLWMGYARNQSLTRMSNAGRLEGLSEISQGVGLDIRPYIVSGLSQSPGRGLPDAKGDTDVGADFFYNLTPSLRANFTVNTDFAETEVDQRRVNLTRFPLRFPEQRDFFLEGNSFFNFAVGRLNSFFSRRIGLSDAGTPQVIHFGAKLTGQVGANQIGFLQMQTAAEPGLAGEDFTVLRTRRQIFTQSYFGMIYTRRSQRGVQAKDRHTLGLDFALDTSEFRGSDNLNLSGYWAWNNNPDRERGHLGGHAFGVRLAYPNDPWNSLFSYREWGEDHNPAIGFVPRVNIRRFSPQLNYAPRPNQHPWIRRFSFGWDGVWIGNFEGQLLSTAQTFTAFSVDLHSGDSFRINIVPSFERLTEDFRIHPGVVLPQDGAYHFTRYRFVLSTASQRPIAFNSTYEVGTFLSGDRREFAVGVDLRPRNGVLLGLEGEWNKVDLSEGRFATSLLRASADTQFNPWVSVNNNIQYDTRSRVLGWQTRFRWIVRPGNDIFFTYVHNWEDDFLQMRTLDQEAVAKLSYTHRF